MRLFFLDGNRSGALRQYERCVAALDEELGVQPSQQTQALHCAIQADRLDGPPQPMVVPIAAQQPLQHVLERLKKIQGTLSDAQLQIQRDIQTVERVIDRLR
jgi:DNA-binding SARP family transcriptional activator